MSAVLRRKIFVLAFAGTMLLSLAQGGISPSLPTDGWGYYLEGRRSETWPACPYRFLSYPDDCSSIDLWSGAGANQLFTLKEENASAGLFSLRTGCGGVVTYSSSDCSEVDVTTTDTSNPVARTSPSSSLPSSSSSSVSSSLSATFKLTETESMSFTLEAVDRDCPASSFLTFPAVCATSSPDHVFLGSGGLNSSFYLHPTTPPSDIFHIENTPAPGCADPFVWQDPATGQFRLSCTSGSLPLLSAPTMAPNTVFEAMGSMLDTAYVPTWASNSARWAPENLPLTVKSEGDGKGGGEGRGRSSGGKSNVCVFCDTQDSGKHRVGWVLSSDGAEDGAWSTYANATLDLGDEPGGDIDPHLFTDSNDGQSYLIWKTDDNNVGDAATRIWAVPVTVSAEGGVVVNAEPTVIMDSTGLWWVDSWVDGGSLVEGPEVVQRDGFYYLFFAAGRFCQDSYSEGVARSRSIFGPYEKMGAPLLTTNLVGHSAINGEKLVGPGHAAFAQGTDSEWNVVWHASQGENCYRYAYVDRLQWTSGGWPVVSFTPVNQTHMA